MIVCVISFSQNGFISIHLMPRIGGVTLQAEKKYYLPAIKDSISISELKFYVSNVKLLMNEKVMATSDDFFLLDIHNESSFQIQIKTKKNKKFNKLKFCVGIDSVTNISGARGGVLDPTNGMYWTWQSGYINFKLEGRSAVCSTRNHVFQFHIGGYQKPYCTLQTIEMEWSDESDQVIFMNMDNLFNSISLSETCEVMSPGEKAKSISNHIVPMFEKKK